VLLGWPQTSSRLKVTARCPLRAALPRWQSCGEWHGFTPHCSEGDVWAHSPAFNIRAIKCVWLLEEGQTLPIGSSSRREGSGQSKTLRLVASLIHVVPRGSVKKHKV